MDDYASAAPGMSAAHDGQSEAGDALAAATIHGGDLSAARRVYGGEARDWLDLSTGINPRPYPFETVSRAFDGDDWANLPQRDALDALLAAARRYYACDSDACGELVAAPGSESLVQLMPLLWPRARVAVLGPCYDGHASAWRAARHMVEEMRLLPAAAPGQVVIVVNPNNPDGRLFDAETLAHYGRSLADRGGLLIVDEAFADLTPEQSLAPRAGESGALVLRSFGKFFGLAGLRLGFAFGAPAVVSRLRAGLGSWPVSAPALAVGAAALADRAWIEETRARLAERAAALDALLGKHAIEIVGGTDLYRLVRHGDAHGLFDRLARAHILTRPFDAARDRLRIAPPVDDAGLERVDRALSGAIR